MIPLFLYKRIINQPKLVDEYSFSLLIALSILPLLSDTRLCICDKSIIFPYSQEGEFLFSLWKRDNAGYITLTSIDVSDFFQDTEFLGYVRGDDIVDVFDKIMNMREERIWREELPFKSKGYIVREDIFPSVREVSPEGNNFTKGERVSPEGNNFTKGERVSRTIKREAAIERLIPAGPKFQYGLIGGRYIEEDIDFLKILLLVNEEGEIYTDSLASKIDIVRIGLPSEYIYSVIKGVQETHSLRGTLTLNCSAFGKIGSCPYLFYQLSKDLINLMTR